MRENIFKTSTLSRSHKLLFPLASLKGDNKITNFLNRIIIMSIMREQTLRAEWFRAGFTIIRDLLIGVQIACFCVDVFGCFLPVLLFYDVY